MMGVLDRVLAGQRARRALLLRIAPLQRTSLPVSDQMDTAEKWSAALPLSLRVLLARADMEIDGRLIPVLAGSTVLLCVVAGAAFGGIAALVLLLLPMLAAYCILQWRAARNLAGFVADLPLLLDSVQQLLRVGNSLQQALVKSVEGAGDPVRRFLSPAVHRIQNGMAATDALVWAAERIDLPELHMLAAAVRINGRFGGSMTAILGNLSQMLRQSARINRDLKAATAEARFSGIVLMAMPLVIAAMMMALNPEYLRYFIETAGGRRLALIAIALQLTGMAVMRRLMRLVF